MRRTLVASLAGFLLMSWTLSGCVWIEQRKDRGLHKGQYKEPKVQKGKGAPPGKGR